MQTFEDLKRVAFTSTPATKTCRRGPRRKKPLGVQVSVKSLIENAVVAGRSGSCDWKTECPLEVSNTEHLSVKAGRVSGAYFGVWNLMTAAFKMNAGRSGGLRCFN
jgi:hypothetical protein